MKIEIQDQIRNQAELALGVNQAVAVIQEEIAPSRFSGNVTAEWTMPERESNGQKVQLKMFDPMASFEMQFSPTELQNKDRLLAGVRKLWSQILQNRSKQQAEKIRDMMTEWDAKEEA